MNHNKVKSHRLKIATRSSPLALIQADYVKKNLQRQGISSELCQIKTTGDRIQDRPLHEIGGKGLFIKELEKSLINKDTHIAVHSLKDLPCELNSQFKFVAYLSRNYFHDVLVVPGANDFFHKQLKGKVLLTEKDFAQLDSCLIGTGSLRRKALVQNTNSRVKVAPIRGNINTRLGKLQAGEMDALILSEASLVRLNILPKDFVFYKLDPQWFVPCTAQGVIVVESLADSVFEETAFHEMSCEKTRKCCELERAVLSSLGGSCLLPIGIYFVHKDGFYWVHVLVMNEEGSKILRYQEFFPVTEGKKDLVAKIKKGLYDKNVNDILQDLGLEPITG